MVAEFRRHGLGVVVDVVPNHMARPVPETLNRQLWSVLYRGRASEFASWFDVDWDAQEGKLLLPILAGPLEECLRDLIIDTAPRNPENPRAPRAGAALLRPRAPAPRRRRRPAPRRPAGPAALPAHRLARRGHPAQLPALLRHRLADRGPGRGSRRVRRDPRGAAAAGARGPDRRPAGRPSRRAGRPARATWPGWRPRPTAPGWWWRRSWRTARNCPTGRARAPPDTTFSAWSTGCSSTPRGTSRWPTSTSASPAASRASPRWSGTPSATSPTAPSPPSWPGWPGCSSWPGYPALDASPPPTCTTCWSRCWPSSASTGPT